MTELKTAPETVNVNKQFEIVLGNVSHLDTLAELMDQYRVFYGQPSNRPEARHFLFERIINHDSVIYLALQSGTQQALGFAQLYPSFSSVSLESLWILNDLFVIPAARGQGIGTALIREAMTLAAERGDKGLTLSTARDNTAAQHLYEKLGFMQDNHFLHYEYWVEK